MCRPRTVFVLSIVYFVAVATLPLLFSRDVYSYAFYGRIAGVYHANPYIRTPLEFSGDPLWVFVGPKWVDTPAVYGPLWTMTSAVIAQGVPAARPTRWPPTGRSRSWPASRPCS